MGEVLNMTVKEMKSWKETGKPKYKYKEIYKFWKTDPTDEQEQLRSRISRTALLIGMVYGLVIGLLVGALSTW